MFKIKAIIIQNLKIFLIPFLISLNALIILIHNLLILRFDFSLFKYYHPILFNFNILLSISLIYLSLQLLKQKHIAWLVTTVIYAVYTLDNFLNLLVSYRFQTNLLAFLLLSLGIFILLINLRKNYRVKSDLISFRTSINVIILVILATVVYGVGGFLILGQKNFHIHFTLLRALHYTLDQFNITTNHQLIAYTRKARFFIDSLTFVSIASLIFVSISLFKPIKSYFVNDRSRLNLVKKLIINYDSHSEDFFKLWPEDKHYFFNDNLNAVIAYKLTSGVAIALGDPSGQADGFEKLIADFSQFCYLNDWKVSFVHVSDQYLRLYEQNYFKYQRIGQEAVVNIEKFLNSTRNQKYFRNIKNRFQKEGFESQVFLPPHDDKILASLENISNDWLKVKGREERGFAMGYFDRQYLNLCPIFVIKNKTGRIEAFLNQIPPEIDHQEATYDMLRHSRQTKTNINDFLLINFIEYLSDQGFKSLNLGLCPLVGLDSAEHNGPINDLMKFIYAHGQKIYSFQGLYRFKAKYEPDWRNRYLIYRGSFRSLIKILNALLKSMKVKTKVR